MRRPTPRQVAAVREATQLLFTACAWIRFVVRLHNRGEVHKAVRLAFGEGMRAAATRPADVRALARQILSGAEAHPGVLVGVKGGRATLRRVLQLLTRLERIEQARQEPMTATEHAR